MPNAPFIASSPLIRRDYTADELFETRHQDQYCLVAINGKIRDVTKFLGHHPGGANVIAQCRGHVLDLSTDPNHFGVDIEAQLDRAHCHPIGLLVPS